MTVTSISATQEGAFQSIAKRAQLFCFALSDEFDLSIGRRGIDKLYQDGVRLVQNQTESNFWSDKIIFDVLEALKQVIPLKTTTPQPLLSLALAKTYRIFIELAWHQPSKQNSLFTPTDTKKLIDACDRAIAELAKNEIALQFEYTCAAQAARCLASSTEKKGVETWYADIHQFRWDATGIRTKEGFDRVIQPHINRLQTKGGNYTVCLAIVLMELLQNPDSEKDLQVLATQHIVDLCRLRDKGKGIHWDTHLLIAQHIDELRAIESCKDLIFEVLRTLGASKKNLSDEKEALQAKIATLRSRIDIDRSEQIDLFEKALETLHNDQEELVLRIRQLQQQLIKLSPPRIIEILFEKWKYGNRHISTFYYKFDDQLWGRIQDRSGLEKRLNPDQVKCGINGSIPHHDFIQTINKLAPKKIIAFPYPLKGEVSEVWIFQASASAAPWIREAKEQLKQAFPTKAIELYRQALKSFEIAFGIEEKQKSDTSELEPLISKLKNQILLLEARENITLNLPQSEAESFEKTLQESFDEDDLAGALRRCAWSKSAYSISQNLANAISFELSGNSIPAIQYYFDLAKQTLSNPLPFLKKAELIAKKDADPSIFLYFLGMFYAFLKTNLNPLQLDPTLKSGLLALVLDAESLKNISEKKNPIDKVENIDVTQLAYIGTIFFKMGEFSKSITCLEKALSIQHKKGGVFLENQADYNELATAYLAIGELQLALGRLQEAKQNFQHALTCEQLAGETTTRAVLQYESIGKAFLRLSKFNEALISFSKALEIRFMLFQKRDLGTALLMDSLGKTYQKLGKLDEALRYFHEALTIRVELHQGQENLDVMKSFVCIGACYSLQNEHKKALLYFERAIEIKEKNHIEDQNMLEFITAYYFMGLSLNSLKKTTKSLHCLQKVVDLLHQHRKHEKK